MQDKSTGPAQGATQPAGRASRLRRWGPLAGIASLMALAFAMGWHEFLSLKTIALNYEVLKSFIATHWLAALALYIGVYVLVVALSLPGGLVMTLTGGLLFGWFFGAIAAVIGATAGATIVFLVAKSSFGETLAAKAGPWVSKLRAGFQENALSYLLFLRLVPAFPFFVINLAPALLGVPLRTYVLGTALGIVPGTTAFAFAGAGLASVVEAQNATYHACLARHAGDVAACPYTIDTSALVTKELLMAFAMLGVVALIPVALEKWKSRHAR